MSWPVCSCSNACKTCGDSKNDDNKQQVHFSKTRTPHHFATDHAFTYAHTWARNIHTKNTPRIYYKARGSLRGCTFILPVSKAKKNSMKLPSQSKQMFSCTKQGSHSQDLVQISLQLNIAKFWHCIHTGQMPIPPSTHPGTLDLRHAHKERPCTNVQNYLYKRKKSSVKNKSNLVHITT